MFMSKSLTFMFMSKSLPLISKVMLQAKGLSRVDLVDQKNSEEVEKGEFWKQPDELVYKPCLDFSRDYRRDSDGVVKNRKRYLMVVVSGRLNQQRNQIVDVVVLLWLFLFCKLMSFGEFVDIFDLCTLKMYLPNRVDIIHNVCCSWSKEVYDASIQMGSAMKYRGVNPVSCVYGANSLEWIIAMEEPHTNGPVLDDVLPQRKCWAVIWVLYYVGKILSCLDQCSLNLKTIVSFGNIFATQKKEAEEFGTTCFFRGEFLRLVFRSIDSNSVKGFPKEPKDAIQRVK
ncbi:O-fucosyltransferase [Trifolium repens]|nr:O-fucosyltransferase [Trifolium repens]